MSEPELERSLLDTSVAPPESGCLCGPSSAYQPEHAPCGLPHVMRWPRGQVQGWLSARAEASRPGERAISLMALRHVMRWPRGQAQGWLSARAEASRPSECAISLMASAPASEF